MDHVYGYLICKFYELNTSYITQQNCPIGWTILKEVAIAGDYAIEDHRVLYRVPQVFGSDRYAFVRTADGNIADFEWSCTPDAYALWFEEG